MGGQFFNDKIQFLFMKTVVKIELEGMFLCQRLVPTRVLHVPSMILPSKRFFASVQRFIRKYDLEFARNPNIKDRWIYA
jgi:hypothetical protein